MWLAGADLPDDLQKIAVGACICAASNLLLVAAIAAAGDGLVHPVWPFLYCAGQGIGFIYYWPTLLALVSRTTPAQVNATSMGFAFMTLFVSNNPIGWIGSFYERMTPLQFLALLAGIALTGATLTFLLRSTLRRMLAAGPVDQPLRASALTLEVER